MIGKMPTEIAWRIGAHRGARARTDASTLGNLDMIDLDEFHTCQNRRSLI